VVTAVAQEARLTITGEAAWLNARVLSPEGDLVVANIRLFKEIQGKRNEFAATGTGILEARVSLGRYIVCVYIGGEKLAEEAVDMNTANEHKEIKLTVKTVYFANFGIVPNHYTEGGKLAFAKVVYQVRNLYQPVPQVELVLNVNYAGVALEEVPMLSLSELTLGDISGSRDYVPPQGWQTGAYTFQAELRVAGQPYSTTLEEVLDVTVPAAVGFAVFGGITGAILVAIAVAVPLLLARRRRVFKRLEIRY